MENKNNLSIAHPIFKIGCASIGKIMTESREKSMLQKRIDLENERVGTFAKIEELELKHQQKITELNKTSEKAISAAEKLKVFIDKITSQISILKEKIEIQNVGIMAYDSLIAQGQDFVFSDTCKSYLHNWAIRKKYGKSNNFTSSQTEKGNQVEEDSIDFLNSWELTNYKKNEQGFENDFVRGVPDIVEGIDIKSSYNYNTFFDAKIKPLNPDYYWQAQGYMSLQEFKHLDKWDITYCCVNTPYSIIEAEIRKAQWARGYYWTLNEVEKEEIRLSHSFDDIPINKRIHTFTVERDNEAIDKIKQKVLHCRTYINNIWELI